MPWVVTSTRRLDGPELVASLRVHRWRGSGWRRRTSPGAGGRRERAPPRANRKNWHEIGRKPARRRNDEGHLAVAFALSRPVCRALASPTPWSASIAGAG